MRKVGRYIGLLITLHFSMVLYAQSFDIHKLSSSVLFPGDSITAYRDPLPFYNNGELYLYFTLTQIENNGKIFMYTAMSKTRDLIHWSPVKKITVKDQALNYSSPGSIIRYNGEWIMCLQTYPRPGYTNLQMPKYGDETSRLFIMRSKNLERWSAPELLYVKGDTVAEKNMGRMIDPFLMEDKNEKGKWWVFYKQNGASRSYSYDLKHWIYNGHVAAGENVCIVQASDEYIMFHSPENGIGVKRSTDLVHWKDDPGILTLGQDKWNWAKGRLTAGYVLDTKISLPGYRYLLFFHGSGPKTEKQGDFDKNASLALAWSKDMVKWEWK